MREWLITLVVKRDPEWTRSQVVQDAEDRMNSGEYLDTVRMVNASAIVFREFCPHKNKITHPEDETFYSREGCVDCNTWLQPVRIKTP